LTQLNWKKKLLKACMILMVLTLLLGSFPIAAAQEGDINAVIRNTNAERERHGLPALVADPLLNELAAVRVREIVGQSHADRAQHVRPNGQAATRWVLDEGAGRFTGVGENSALGTSGHIGAARVVEGWMNSTGHRRNILGQSANFTHIGVGFFSDGVNDFWVQLFAIERAGGAAQGGAAAQPTPAAPPAVTAPATHPAAGISVAQAPTVAGIPVAPRPGIAVSAAPSGATSIATPQVTITPANAAAMTQQAIQAAAPGAVPVITVINQAEIQLAALQAVASAAGNNPVRINADTRTVTALDVRISILNPSAATRDLNLAASTTSASAIRTHRLFSRSFDGPMMVVSMEQQENFGMEVRVTTRLDPDLDAGNLLFYSFNTQTNTFTRFTPNTRVDDNGFLHFNTTLAGDIIISNTRF
jgi:hypothetical protein